MNGAGRTCLAKKSSPQSIYRTESATAVHTVCQRAEVCVLRARGLTAGCNVITTRSQHTSCYYGLPPSLPGLLRVLGTSPGPSSWPRPPAPWPLPPHLIEVICLTTSAGECRSIRRLWML